MTPSGRAAALLAAIMLGGCVTAPAPASHEPSVISVRATGRTSVKPDTVFVNVGVESREPMLAAATADATRRMTATLVRLKALGVAEADIVTVGYSVDPIPAQRRTEEDPTRIVAYRVANVVRVRIRDVAAAASIVDAAVAAGANTVSALQFTVSDPARAEREARAQAVTLAAAKARELAAAAGVPVGEVLSIEEDVALPRPMLAQSGVMLRTGPGPIEAGELEIVVSVHARYRLGSR
jgi:uncharacterized protein YggE